MQSPSRTIAQRSPDSNGVPSEGNLLRKVKVVFLGISLFSVLAIHLPSVPLPVRLAAHAFANLIGQEHGWRMFSADPPGPSVDLFASMRTPNGETRTWEIDRRRLGGDLAHYHWVKWTETAVQYPALANLSGLTDWLVSQSDESYSEIVVYGQITWRREPPLPGADSEVVVLHRSSGDR
jgi:hypothetical protein